MIDIAGVLRRYRIAPCGVIHVGAHKGEEVDLYRKIGFPRILLIEPLPECHSFIVAKIEGSRDATCVKCAVGSYNGTALLRVTNEPQSSSLLELAGHRALYPGIVETEQVEVEVRTLDALLVEIGHSSRGYNFLNMDIQGMEGEVLESSQTWHDMDAILLERSKSELYLGQQIETEVDAILDQAGFVLVAEDHTYSKEWGDGMFVKRSLASQT